MRNHSFTATSKHLRPELVAVDHCKALEHVRLIFPNAFLNGSTFMMAKAGTIGQVITVPGEDVPNRAAFRKAVGKLIRARTAFLGQ